MAGKTKAKSPDQELLEVARKRFDLCQGAETEQRELQLDDWKFRSGEQWPSKIKADREMEGKPCITINKIVQSVHQVTNDQRQNRPSIKVSPVDDKATLETAEVLQGLIRHIENFSHADAAYDRAFEGAVTSGIGYFRIITGYCDSNSFDQEIFIKSIRNAAMVSLDPHYQEPDASDANYGFITVEMSKDDFKAQYPGSKLDLMEDWTSVGASAPGWITKDTARVAEYFYKTFKKVKIHQLSDGSVVEDKDLESALAPKPQDPANPQAPAPQLTVVNERETTKPAIKWAKINGIEVLEETDWLGAYIPIIPVIGDEMDIDGRVIREGIVRQAKDPARMYNYFASSEAEAIALTPKAPWIGAAGQFKGFEKQWQNSNRKNQPYLEYNDKTLNGQPIGPPQRVMSDANVGAITNARQMAGEDLKATTGIFDATLGNKSQESSGVAIQRRTSQAQTSNYHFVDNLARALRHGGRIILDLIPKVYDSPRIARILHEDGEAEMVPVNQPYEQNGKPMKHDLSKGAYDVVISTGPNFQTKRMEASQNMIEFTKALPQAAPLISDLIARNQDWPGAQEIADRLKKTLPPGIADADNGQEPLPPEVKQTLDKQKQTIDMLTQHLHAQQDEIDQKKMELDSKERIAMAQIQADIEINLAKLGSQAAAIQLGHEVSVIDSQLDRLHMAQAQQIEIENQPPPQAPAEIQPPTGGQSPGPSMGV